MKLFEAMLKGAKMKPQVFGTTFEKGGSCAVGAVIDGAGIQGDTYSQLRLAGELFPLMGMLNIKSCPVQGCAPSWGQGNALIPHLNDQHRWSRENIAYYIRDTYEKDVVAETTTAKGKQYESVI